MFNISAIRVVICYHITAHIALAFSASDGQLAVLILTWHDALIHQLLPGSPLLKPQLQDWRQKHSDCYFENKKKENMRRKT